MHVHSHKRQSGRKWSYSLKSLLFLSCVVAIYSAIMGSSVVLAVMCLPFFVGALVRTRRIHRQTAADEPRAGLFVTFCRSMVIEFCMIAVSTIAIAVASCAGVLIVLGIVVRHVLRPVGVLLRAIVRYASRISIHFWRRVMTPGVYGAAAKGFVAIRDFAVTMTRSLFSACRTLWRRWWCPVGRCT